jgi:hypothetical protein
MAESGDELEALRRENARLRKLLTLTKTEVAPALGTQAAWFDRAPGPVDGNSTPDAKVAFYAALFGARRDMYAIRWENARRGTSGWVPAVEGGWRKGSKATEQRYLPLTANVLAAHLTGDTHIGLYPMLPGDQTCWLVADFDEQAAMLDTLAYLKAARAVSAPAALEVSRSGVGAHVWIFFTDPVSATIARQVGTGLVREAIAIRGRMDLRCYDRLFPPRMCCQPMAPGTSSRRHFKGSAARTARPCSSISALSEPHENQWDYLSTLERLTPRQVAKPASALREPLVGSRMDRTQPRSAPIVHLTLDGGIRIRGEELSPSRHTLETADAGTLEGASAERPHPVLVVHSTNFHYDGAADLSAPGAIAGIHRDLAADPARNEQVLADVVDAHSRGRHCLVLAQRTAHVDHLAAGLSDRGLEPVVLKGWDGRPGTHRRDGTSRRHRGRPATRCGRDRPLCRRRIRLPCLGHAVPGRTGVVSRAESSSTSGASCVPIQARRPPRSTTTTTSRPRCLQRPPQARARLRQPRLSRSEVALARRQAAGERPRLSPTQGQANLCSVGPGPRHRYRPCVCPTVESLRVSHS